MGKVPGAPGYLALSIGIRMVGLPAILLRATTGSSAPDWRSPLPVVAASAVAVLVYGAGRLLAEGGVSLFGIRAGPRLVVEGPYAALRNPQDLGSTLPALAAPIALDAAVLWAVPVCAVVVFAAGLEPQEDRCLEAAFGDDFSAYRRAVGAWLPRPD